MTAADVQRAIEIVEKSRQTHVNWLDHPDGCPDCAAAIAAMKPSQIAGDRAHHQACIEGYDHVLSVLNKALEGAK